MSGPVCPRCHRSGPGVRFQIDFTDPANPFNACEDCELRAAAEGEKAKAALVGSLQLVLDLSGADGECRHLDFETTLDGGRCLDCGVEQI